MRKTELISLALRLGSLIVWAESLRHCIEAEDAFEYGLPRQSDKR
jgi:hypothetical protein